MNSKKVSVAGVDLYRCGLLSVILLTRFLRFLKNQNSAANDLYMKTLMKESEDAEYFFNSSEAV